MIYRNCFLLWLCLFARLSVVAAQSGSIHTKEGLPILGKKQLISNCLQSFHKAPSDSLARLVCQCQVSKLDNYFTARQYRHHTFKGVIDLAAMIKEDSLMNAQINACFKGTGNTILMQAEGFEDEFLATCKENIVNSTTKTLSPDHISQFCQCQLQMIKTKRLTDADMATLSNPNSLLFFETMYTCGDPFDNARTTTTSQWKETAANDVNGPPSDTIDVLTMNGLTYVKMKTGSLVQFWLFDTGASDLLINTDMEKTLTEEGILSGENSLGTGEYELANGTIDTCRKYRINNIRIGNYWVNNVTVAVSDTARRIIIGKSLLNKFSNWILDNRNNYLLLHK